MLKFIIRNQVMYRADTFRVVANSENYLKAKFIFETDDWIETDSKTATFKGMDGKPYCVLIDENNECVVPWEALVSEGEMYVSIIGMGNNTRITTNTMCVLIEESGDMDGILIDKPSTLSVVEQILEKLNIHQYTEDKKIVGKWINGLPIYEITFVDKNILASSGKMVAKSDIESEQDISLIDVKCVAKLNQTRQSKLPTIEILTSPSNRIEVFCTLNYLEGNTSADFYTTIQYIEGDM